MPDILSPRGKGRINTRFPLKMFWLSNILEVISEFSFLAVMMNPRILKKLMCLVQRSLFSF